MYITIWSGDIIIYINIEEDKELDLCGTTGPTLCIVDFLV